MLGLSAGPGSVSLSTLSKYLQSEVFTRASVSTLSILGVLNSLTFHTVILFECLIIRPLSSRNLTVMSSSQFNLLYFASASSFTRKSTESFDAPSTAAKLFDTLEKKYPGIKDKILGSCALTVNLDYVDLDAPEEVVIKAGDEVAVIPPVSSG